MPAPSRHRRAATSRRRPRPAPVPQVQSELERMLDEALARPVPEVASFAELGIPDRLVTALNRRGITAPFAIQTRTLPDGIAGRDVLGRAQTGSGKTLAFGLPMLSRLAGDRSRPGHPRGLVLVPTRELAMQVTDELRPLGEMVGLRMVAVFGGAPYGRQIAALERGVDIVIATPGRLIDLIDRGCCDLSEVSVAVLDEADYMADLGFMPPVVRLLDSVPSDGQRLLFSATLDRGVDKLVENYLTDPAVHAIAPAAAPVESMDHQAFLLDNADKVVVAAEIASRPGRTLVFVRTKHGADRLARQLSKLGADAAAIHGNLTQAARQRALAGFAAGHPRVLVATDVAARGIHVEDVDLVVHFDPPNDSKDYLHRSGRTARAGASGTVVSLVLPDQRREVERLHRDARVSPIAVQVQPGHEAVRLIAESGTPIPPPPPVEESAVASKRRPARGAGGRGTGSRGAGSRGADSRKSRASAGPDSSRPPRRPYNSDAPSPRSSRGGHRSDEWGSSERRFKPRRSDGQRAESSDGQRSERPSTEGRYSRSERPAEGRYSQQHPSGRRRQEESRSGRPGSGQARRSGQRHLDQRRARPQRRDSAA
jgi:superfamily II DNA/RNA helicase